MPTRLHSMRPALLAIWASFVVHWQEFGREKAVNAAITGEVALLLVPLLLAQLAFGVGGFVASGGSDNVVAYVGLGWLALLVAQQALLSGQGYLRWANETGVLPHLWTTPVARWIPLLGVALFDLIQWLAIAAVLFVVLVVFPTGAPLVFNPLAIPTVALGLAAFWGFGIALGGAGMVWRQWRIPYLVNAVLFTLAGPTFPIAMLPWEIRWVSYAIPHTYVIDAMRATLLGTTPLIPLAAEIGVVALCALLAVFGGIALFNRIDRYAIRRGLIGLYT